MVPCSQEVEMFNIKWYKEVKGQDCDASQSSYSKCAILANEQMVTRSRNLVERWPTKRHPANNLHRWKVKGHVNQLIINISYARQIHKGSWQKAVRISDSMKTEQHRNNRLRQKLSNNILFVLFFRSFARFSVPFLFNFDLFVSFNLCFVTECF